MSNINRQQYMAELSRLLSFMFKEDRGEILKEYNAMLDDAENEEEMLRSFGSPTRLAVTIAHKYNSGELRTSAPPVPENVSPSEPTVIVRPEPAAVQEPPKPREPELSFVDVLEELRREKAKEEGIEYTPIFFDEAEASEEPEIEVEVYEEEPVSEEAASESSDEVSEEVPSEEQPEEPESSDEQTIDVPQEATEESPEADAPAEDETSAVETPAGEAEASEEEAEAIDSEEEPAGENKAEAEPANSAPSAVAPTEESAEKPAAPVKTKKTKVGALILYLIFAIPIGLALLAAAISVGLVIIAAGVILFIAGFKLLAFSLSGMPLIADIIMSLGVTIAVLAVGIFVLWLGIWIVAVSVKNLPRLAVLLGKKLCVEEVSLDG